MSGVRARRICFQTRGVVMWPKSALHVVNGFTRSAMHRGLRAFKMSAGMPSGPGAVPLRAANRLTALDNRFGDDEGGAPSKAAALTSEATMWRASWACYPSSPYRARKYRAIARNASAGGRIVAARGNQLYMAVHPLWWQLVLPKLLCNTSSVDLSAQLANQANPCLPSQNILDPIPFEHTSRQGGPSYVGPGRRASRQVESARVGPASPLLLYTFQKLGIDRLRFPRCDLWSTIALMAPARIESRLGRHRLPARGPSPSVACP